MKRYGYLFEQITDPDNLRTAFFKAHRGKSGKRDVQLFRQNMDSNLLHIRTALLDDSYRFGDYHFFTIFDPKQRTICAASFAERVIHHAIMNVCAVHFENRQIPYSYACRKNKGTFAAIEQAARFEKKYQWYLKLDIRKYFDHINHAILYDMLCRMYKDSRLLGLFLQIIDSYHADDGRGVPIGNLTSQYFANHYLSMADRYVTEQLQIPAYLRYMDDMFLWSNSQTELIEKGTAFENFVSDHLKLSMKPFILNRTTHGLPALGFIIFPHYILLNRRSKNRFAEKLTQYADMLREEKIDEGQFSRYVLALYAFIGHANTKGFAKHVLQISGLDTEGSNRVNRGGSWNNNAQNVRVPNRNNNTPDNRNNNIGFRLVRSTKQQILNKCPYPSLVTEGKNNPTYPLSSKVERWISFFE